MDSVFTLLETNITPEDQRLEDELPVLGWPIFSFHVNLPGCIISMVGFFLCFGIFWMEVPIPMVVAAAR